MKKRVSLLFVALLSVAAVAVALTSRAAGDPRWIGEATAIEAVKTAEGADLENAVIYNLNGQRIDKAQAKSGVFIVNGKKVILK